MAATRYTYATTLAYSTGDVPEVDEVEVEVSFSVAWGSPETGRWGPPENYDPGAGDEIEDLRLERVNGTKSPGPDAPYGAGALNQEYEAAILQEIAQNHAEAMLSEARDHEAAWADDAAERAYESRREADRGW